MTASDRRTRSLIDLRGNTTTFTYDELVRPLGPPNLIDCFFCAKIDISLGVGSVVERRQYEAFGATSGALLTRYGYTGRELDANTGLMYFRARWYDPEQGRFLSEDPAGLSGGLNSFADAANNPLSFVDPFSLDAWDTFLGYAANISAGFGDTISFGLTRKVRQWMGTDDVIDPCSGRSTDS